MALTATLTGTIGGGTTLSAAAFTGVSVFHIYSNTNVVQMDYAESGKSPTFVSVAAAATVTATKSGSTWTITIS